MDTTLAILGAGRMGEALLGGLLRSGWITPDRVRCTVRGAERATALAATYGVHVDTDSPAAAAAADVLLVAVKPQNLRALLDQIAGEVTPRHTVISVAAGVPTAAIEDALAPGVPVVRVMSNVPVQVDEAMSAVAPGCHAGAEHLAVADAVLGSVGKVVHLAEEHLDAVTALSGSGPAYFFLLAEAMIDAGILLGLSRDVSSELVIQTMVGSAKMLRDTGRHPVELREAVTSPGGTTIAAVRVLEQERVRAAFLNAIEAAKLRSTELAGG
ncbi:MAG: pyrroline-5-carboxylate reductase [Actinomycetota bacterium]|nr:pyrroline-5-carboxylate reductase [Actinomycetota bacterium]